MVPIHKYPELKDLCCDLINSEWPRNTTARMRTLDSSRDRLPTCLVLTKDDNKLVLGHLKLTAVPSDKKSCFVESVVISKDCRGQGLGTLIMRQAEIYCKEQLRLKQVYLSTYGQEDFYSKLGYSICEPISIYGSFSIRVNSVNTMTRKTFMNKFL